VIDLKASVKFGINSKPAVKTGGYLSLITKENA
jgi:hypothetical protein